MNTKRHRLWLVAAFCWFLVLSVGLPTRIMPFVYPYLLAWALPYLLSATVRRLPVWLVGGSASALFAAAAALVGWPIDAALLLPVTAIFITLVFAKVLGGLDDAYERAVRTPMDDAGSEPNAIGSDDSSLYVELQRARRCQSELSVLAIAPAVSGDAETDARASLAGLLSDENYALELLVARNDHAVLMLPESGSEKAAEFVTRLRSAAWTKLGMELHIGMSSFPAQEASLEGLLDRAESEMRARAKRDDVSNREVPR
ncbi:MAG: hypothetical protein JRH16_16830 [Deltaproteobacteria bacterium]|nr:hypothetical protein [Deltaproteobacteria bacterium]MBW2362050.1 hypothetical protein [Deltaproteobacteria bacterium]